MDDVRQSSQRWNLFARELQDILARRGYRLGQLDDRAHIHPQKVSRLQRSLREPVFHVVTPEELERIGVAFGLSADEMLRLRAAILGTAIEEMLMNRISPDDALTAAEQMLPIIWAALRLHIGESGGMGAIKGNIEDTAVARELDPALEPAIDAIDRAMLALHLSIGARQQRERVARGLEAREHLKAALATLDRANPSARSAEAWSVWRAEASNELVAVETLLKGEGASSGLL